MCIKCRCRALHTCSEYKLSSTINLQETSRKNTDYIRHNYKCNIKPKKSKVYVELSK